jgi:hypothetical protein
LPVKARRRARFSIAEFFQKTEPRSSASAISSSDSACAPYVRPAA